MDKTMPTVRRYDIITNEDELRSLQPEWDALWKRAHGYYHQSFPYAWLSWKHVSKVHGRKFKCVTCRENGQLVMVWPLETSRRALWTYLAPLGPEGGDYTSVLVEDDEKATELIEGAWKIARKRLGADFIHMPYVREHLHLHSLVTKERHILIKEPHNASAAKLQGRGTWEEYCKTLGTLFRKKPGNFVNRLAKEGTVEVRVVDPSEVATTEAVVEWMFKVKRVWSDRVGKRSVWLDSPEFEKYLCKLIYSQDVPSIARLIVVTLNGATVAALIVTFGNPWASAIISGYDPQYSRACPGLIAIERCVKWAFDNGFDLDFGVGTERFKSFWSRDEGDTAWTVQSVNSNWGLLAVRGRRLAREAIARAKQLRQRGEAAPEGGTAGSPLSPAMSEALGQTPAHE
ncbi:MAG TPA: GNAT family N-acetyltransferase [Paraburkholderia sp.]|nr:GNAT family N-acetyltransferase [Paraburkholderia sp.]